MLSLKSFTPFLAVLVLGSPFSFATPPAPAPDWRLVKQDRTHTITTYEKFDPASNLRSYKVEYDVHASMEDMVQVLTDVPNYGKWLYMTEGAKLLRQVSPTEFYVYLVRRFPSPLPDHDTILRVSLQPYNKREGHAIVRMESVPDYIPPKPPLSRMAADDLTVRWTPMPGGWIHVEAMGDLDASSSIPAWALDNLQRQAPYQSALGYIRRVKLGKLASRDRSVATILP